MRQLLKGCVRARPRDRCRESLSEQGHEATSILLHHLSASLSERTRLKFGEGSGLHVSSPPLRPSRADARAPDRQASDRYRRIGTNRYVVSLHIKPSHPPSSN